jgi:hypothetical protein
MIRGAREVTGGRMPRRLRCVSLRSALIAAAFSEAERIVFAAEGLLLDHDFPFNCGIGDVNGSAHVRPRGAILSPTCRATAKEVWLSRLHFWAREIGDVA